MMTRGPKFRCASPSHSRYISDTSKLNGRVMVDAYACFQFNRNERIYLRPLTVTSPINRVNYNGGNRTHPVNPGGPLQRTHHQHRGPPRPPPPPNRGRIEIWDAQSGHMVQETKGPPKEPDQVKLTEEQLLICAPFVRGYSFKTKEWGEYMRSET